MNQPASITVLARGARRRWPQLFPPSSCRLHFATSRPDLREVSILPNSGLYLGQFKVQQWPQKEKGRSKSKGKMTASNSFSKGGKGNQNEPKGQGKSEQQAMFQMWQSWTLRRGLLVWGELQNSDHQGSTSSTASNNNGNAGLTERSDVPAQSATQHRVSQISCHFGDNNAWDESQFNFVFVAFDGWSLTWPCMTALSLRLGRSPQWGGARWHLAANVIFLLL